MATDKLINKLVNGSVLAIDPSSCSSSPIGWALFDSGMLRSSGTVSCPKGLTIQQRLQQIAIVFLEEFPNVDVLVVERIAGGMSHRYLPWAVGAIAATTEADYFLEIPVPTWKSLASDEWQKGDEADAIEIGRVAIKLAHDDTSKVLKFRTK